MQLNLDPHPTPFSPRPSPLPSLTPATPAAASPLPEPVLPPFHRLSRAELDTVANQFLAQQEMAVFKAFVMMVANRTVKDVRALGEFRGALAREIRGLDNLRREFEEPKGEYGVVDVLVEDQGDGGA